MLIGEFLNELGYADSPFFLKKGTRAFSNAQNIGHILRAAAKPECGLFGVYSLKDPGNSSTSQTPIVYVCKAKTEAEADKIHRLVWNQDITPFLIVLTPRGIKFYSGFEYSNSGNGHLTNLLDFNQAIKKAKEFHADEINSGRFWKGWSKHLRPEKRVNRRLLDNLKTLDSYLQNKFDLSRHTSHALIGKYVYLHYLRDRDILSDRKLSSWGVTDSQIFGSKVSIAKLKTVIDNLEEWLNGNIFPITFNGINAPKTEHVKLVAGVFSGDDILPSGYQQLSLDFKAYDFSYIPIETLSVVYEQFLHTPDEDGNSQGREEGAYYTPIPVVNYMLAEMEESLPLVDGVQVFDPACGSGAFLVQCYRRLIEKTYPHNKHPTVHPIQLRQLLIKNIFGLDRDEDACAVSELSLLLTLLDYVDPPDLEDDKRIKLPTLRNKNIFHADFFEPLPPLLKNKIFHWIVGNPPWKKLNPRKLMENDFPAWNWMQENKRERPVGGNELARAFAWRITELTDCEGEIGFFMPAMTLFDKQTVDFRKLFFEQMHLKRVANFSNLAEIISAGRFRVPSAAFFFSPFNRDSPNTTQRNFVRVFSPLVANQEPVKPESAGERIESWCIVLNESEIRDIPYSEISTGAGLPWKIATWGSHNDVRLLNQLSNQFPSLSAIQDEKLLVISQGPDLRSTSVADGENKTEFHKELVGKNEVDTSALARLRNLFSFPMNALRPCEKHYLRLRAGRRTLSICRGPHVIVSAARTFAIYTDDYLVVPSRQIGIISPSDDRDFLKALSLFLSSDFALYHQLFTSTEFGVKRDRATLDALKQMPCPLTELKNSELKKWVKLHQQLKETTPRRVGDIKNDERSLFPDDRLDDLLIELNELVSESLSLSDRERALVSDFVNIRLELNDGKVGRRAIEPPRLLEIKQYGNRLCQELDEFLGYDSEYHHKVDIIYDRYSGMICVDFVKSPKRVAVAVTPADSPTVKALSETRNELQEEIGQWVYFNRDLQIHNGMKTYLFKPMQRFHWTESQAMVDASEMIAETVSAEGANV
ncbi:N-6 DNA Methylase [Gimesia maris]|uniref:N-6 DNA methylase n=1 Tax=Gimesia maris TaxID=122 RepID=UPI00118B42B2|nr:N-6 DNA methylase [Gimesia maris]QDU16855.1 N-6 DNA Methylase [Gimesia maris]